MQAHAIAALAAQHRPERPCRPRPTVRTCRIQRDAILDSSGSLPWPSSSTSRGRAQTTSRANFRASADRPGARTPERRHRRSCRRWIIAAEQLVIERIGEAHASARRSSLMSPCSRLSTARAQQRGRCRRRCACVSAVSTSLRKASTASPELASQCVKSRIAEPWWRRWPAAWGALPRSGPGAVGFGSTSTPPPVSTGRRSSSAASSSTGSCAEPQARRGSGASASVRRPRGCRHRTPARQVFLGGGFQQQARIVERAHVTAAAAQCMPAKPLQTHRIGIEQQHAVRLRLAVADQRVQPARGRASPSGSTRLTGIGPGYERLQPAAAVGLRRHQHHRQVLVQAGEAQFGRPAGRRRGSWASLSSSTACGSCSDSARSGPAGHRRFGLVAVFAEPRRVAGHAFGRVAEDVDARAVVTGLVAGQAGGTGLACDRTGSASGPTIAVVQAADCVSASRTCSIESGRSPLRTSSRSSVSTVRTRTARPRSSSERHSSTRRR